MSSRTQNEHIQFAGDFMSGSLHDLKRRYEAGERPDWGVYNSIAAGSKHDRLEVFKWLLSTDFESPSEKFWMFVAGSTMAVKFAEAALRVRPYLDCEPIGSQALYSADKSLLAFAISRTGWTLKYLEHIDMLLIDPVESDINRVKWSDLRAWFLEKSGHTEHSYNRWKLGLPYEKLV